MLKTKFSGLSNLSLNTCIYNASGIGCTSFDELEVLSQNPHVGAVLTKTCTLSLENGNILPRYYETDIMSINSVGLANFGYKYYADISDKIFKNKPYFISVNSITDSEKIFGDLNNNFPNVSAIELNLSCPNIYEHRPLAYNFAETCELLRKLTEISDKKYGLKMPPYFDKYSINIISDVIRENSGIGFITCANCVGNGLIIDTNDEKPVISPNGGFGGISGESIKPFALANVKQFYDNLGDRIDIIGCGGIKNGDDAFQYILCGARAVQIGTQFLKEGIGCFERITNELIDIMKKKKYQNIDDFRGKTI